MAVWTAHSSITKDRFSVGRVMNVPNKVILLPLVLFICLQLNVRASNIYVSHDNAVNNSSCWTGGRNCFSINLALKALLNQNSTVSIYIEQGSYTLFNSTETNLINLQYDVEIAGLAEPNKVIIKCQHFAGLSFIRVNKISIRNLTLLGCGSVQISSSVDERKGSWAFLKYQVALYIYECAYLNVTNIHVNSSNGTGLTIYNAKGQVSVVHSVFTNNKPPGYQENEHSSYGGSGLQIEYTYCNLTNSSRNNCDDTDSRVSLNAIYVIKDTKFIGNVANGGNLTTYKASNSKYNNFAFGKGGGFSIIFKGTTTKNTFLFSNIELQSNRARFGGGFYIGFHDTASYNKVNLTKLIVSSNINEGLHTDIWDKDGGGGGGKVIFTGSDFNLFNNTLVIENSNFFDNRGMTGGGFSLELKLDSFNRCNNYLSIRTSNFTNNSAFLGSAAYFSQAFLSPCGPTCFYSEIKQLTFNNNKQICEQTLESFASLPCSGTLYSSNIPLHLTSSSYQNAPISFRNNFGSALEVHASYVKILAGTTVEFINNTADYGGAIALFDCSYLLIYNNTKYIFTSNSANVHGGAIYSDICTSNDQPTTLSSKCFIQYFKSEVHPNNWNSTFIFNSNYLKLDDQHSTSSIYAVNAIPCWQGTSNIPLNNYNDKLNETFCWENWFYEPFDCNANIDSAPAFMKSESRKINLSVRPGDILKLPIEVYDGTGDKKNNVSLSVCIISGSASFSESRANRLCISTSNNQVHLFYHDKEHSSNNKSINLVVKTKGPVSLQIGFNVFFEQCRWPFISGHVNQCSLISDFFCCSSSNSCDSCNKQCFLSELVSNKSYVKGKFSHCISEGHPHTITGQCPLSYYDYKCTTYEDNNRMKCISNRAGPLCGVCATNHSVPLNSVNLECTDCSTNNWGWLYFLLFEIFPVTIMVSLILIFNLKVTNGSINGFIFYSQIITLSIPSWFYPAWMTNLWLEDKAIVGTPNTEVYKFSASTFPFSIWNLNFLTAIPPTKLPICITKSMGSLGAIAFWYVVAVYPLILLVLLYIWLVMYNESYRFVVKVTRPVHQRLARLWQMLRIEPSLTDSIAIIYIVCFSQLANTSFKLLHYTTAYDVENKADSRKVFFYDGSLLYFGWPHALAGLLAISILVSMVILPMFCLLLYQFQFTQQFLNYFKLRREGLSALFDVFTGGFYNGSNKTSDCRYFAGLFLFLRIAIMLIYFTPYYDLMIIPFLQMTFTIVAAGTIMIIRPHSNNIHNLTNFLMLLLLALLSGLTFISPNKKTLVAVIFIMYIPLLFAFGYFLVWSLIKVQLCLSLQREVRNRILTNTNVPSEEHYSYLQSGSISHHFPDRILNPDDYDEIHVSGVSPCDHSVMNSNAIPGSNSVALRITSSTTYGSINGTTTDSDQ